MGRGKRFFTEDMCNNLVKMLTSADTEDIYLAVDSIDANISCVVYKDLYDDLHQSLAIADNILNKQTKWVSPRPGYWSDGARSYVHPPYTEEDQKQVDLNHTVQVYRDRISRCKWQLRKGKKNSSKAKEEQQNTDGKDS